METKHHILSREKKILKTLDQKESFTKLIDAIDLCGLEDEFNRSGPLTVFAPTDNAFLNMPPGLFDSLMMDKARLTDVIKHHVVDNRITSSDAITSKNAMALDGEVLNFNTCDGFEVEDSKIIEADIDCKNGLLHVIDTVLLPKDVQISNMASAPTSGNVKIVQDDSVVGKTMAAGSQKVQNMKSNVKDSVSGMKEKMSSNQTGDKVNDESMTDQMKNKVDNKMNETKQKMENEKTEMKKDMNSENKQ